MVRLLNLIQEKIKSRVDYLQGVFVIQDPERHPRSVGYPMVVVSDGGEEPGEQAGGTIDILTVDIVIFQRIIGNKKEDVSMVGKGSRKGILEIFDDIVRVLETEEFEQPYHRPTRGIADPTITMEEDLSNYIQMKAFDFSWRRGRPYHV